MKKFFFLGAIVCALLMGAMDESQLETKMKAVGKDMGGLRKAQQSKSMADVAKHAKGIAAGMTGTDAFWKQHSKDDGVKWTMDGIEAANALAKAADSNDADGVRTATGKLGASCKGCHEKYREKVGENDYKVKL